MGKLSKMELANEPRFLNEIRYLKKHEFRGMLGYYLGFDILSLREKEPCRLVMPLKRRWGLLRIFCWAGLIYLFAEEYVAGLKRSVKSFKVVNVL